MLFQLQRDYVLSFADSGGLYHHSCNHDWQSFHYQGEADQVATVSFPLTEKDCFMRSLRPHQPCIKKYYKNNTAMQLNSSLDLANPGNSDQFLPTIPSCAKLVASYQPAPPCAQSQLMHAQRTLKLNAHHSKQVLTLVSGPYRVKVARFNTLLISLKVVFTLLICLSTGHQQHIPGGDLSGFVQPLVCQDLYCCYDCWQL